MFVSKWKFFANAIIALAAISNSALTDEIDYNSYLSQDVLVRAYGNSNNNKAPSTLLRGVPSVPIVTLVPNSAFEPLFISVNEGANADIRFTITDSMANKLYRLEITDFLCEGDLFQVTAVTNVDTGAIAISNLASSPLNLTSTNGMLRACNLVNRENNPASALANPRYSHILISDLPTGNYKVQVALKPNGPFEASLIAFRLVTFSTCRPQINTGLTDAKIDSEFIVSTLKVTHYFNNAPNGGGTFKDPVDTCARINPGWKLATLTIENIGRAAQTMRACLGPSQFAFIASWNGDEYASASCGILYIAGNGVDSANGAVIENAWCPILQNVLCQIK